jgi:hypothetical protein
VLARFTFHESVRGRTRGRLMPPSHQLTADPGPGPSGTDIAGNDSEPMHRSAASVQIGDEAPPALSSKY